MNPIPLIRGARQDEVAPGLDSESIRKGILEKLYFELAKFPRVATRNDHALAVSWAVRDRVLERWVRSAETYLMRRARTVIYLSAEYLMGPQLGNNLLATGLDEPVRRAVAALGLDLDEILAYEGEPGLGNGGLGRLAACYMDSLATLDYPAIGHGIRYEFGIFAQAIRDGRQIERTDRWLRHTNPWEVRRHDIELTVGLGGHTEHGQDADGRRVVRWLPERTVIGVPYDTPVPGYRTGNTNFLRLWSAVASEELDLRAFQVGDYTRAVSQKVASENITRILYPSDETEAGKQLRLEQEYFFVSCALQDCIRIMRSVAEVDSFADKFALQLNDTHPALAVPELMRLLMDVHGMSWERAWEITTRSVSYTNHTLMPEALESWPLALFARVLPRHLEIVYEINRRFLEDVRRRFPGDSARVGRMSIIGEASGKTVRMAHLATVASHTVNGVAELHSRLLRGTLLSDFAELWPDRFTNVTNGVTPRRFLALSNPRLAALLTEVVGEGWLTDLEALRGVEALADDAPFQARWRAIKAENKAALDRQLAREHGLRLDPSALLDAQCKRIHEYKRQHLSALHIAALYLRIAGGEDPRGLLGGPRTFLFGGKAAPAYQTAKLIIRLLHAVGDAVAADPRTREWMRVVFVPNFNVRSGQAIYPAADLSEQISLAGKEASGTGNMKFALNGALTIGTLDGANVEIRERVGAENFFLFGLTADEVEARIRAGYRPREVVAQDPELARVLGALSDGRFSPKGERELFRELVQELLDRDPFLVLADFRAYADCQRRVSQAYADARAWTRASILNTARCGYFSSDRAIREYARRIWRVEPLHIAEAEPLGVSEAG